MSTARYTATTMLAWTHYALLLIALLTSALMAGFFFAYSVSVMRGLDATDPLAATLAMRNINALIRTPLFFFAFFGALGLPLLAALVAPRRSVMLLALGGALAYGLGAFLVTVTVNVPMNDVLAAATPTADNATLLWRGYSPRWTLWNHVRTVTSVVAFALLTAALVVAHQR
jgi:uncharacterized membrane protein